MFLSNTSFSVKLQPTDWRPASLLGKEWQRYLAETFPKFYGEQFCKKYVVKPWGNLCGGTRNIAFWNIFWKESAVSSGYSRVVVYTTQTCNFIKTNSMMFSGKFSKLSQSVVFRKISICVEESNHMKDYMPVRVSLLLH